MFQTEFVLLIQSMASDFWTFFFQFWTEIGYSKWAAIVMIFVVFAVNFRTGYILIHVMLWNGMITGFLKNIIMLPRPCNVDNTVQLLGSGPNPSPFKSMGAKSFFAGLPHETVEALRANPIDSWGFPSGHTSSAMTLWGSIFVVFKKPWVRIFAVLAMVCIPLSRVYLGRHFLADILSGYTLGLIAILLFVLINKNDWFKAIFESKWNQIQWNIKSILLMFYFLVVPFLFLMLPGCEPRSAGTLLGVNLGFLLLLRKGVPQNIGSLVQRAGRLLIAFGFYFVSRFAFDALSGLIFGDDSSTGELILYTLLLIIVIWGATELSIKLGFFKRAESVT